MIGFVMDVILRQIYGFSSKNENENENFFLSFGS